MNIYDVPTPSQGTPSSHGREYLTGMIKSLSQLARRSGEQDMAILLEAIIEMTRSQDRRRR